MLESIRGLVTGTDQSYILLETGPVTVRLLAPGYFLRHVSVGDESVFFLLFQIVNEGNKGVPLAVAFPSISDRDFFTKFISVSGVGVRAAAKAMVIPPSELASAIATGDIKVLKSLPGIGNSRAKQIVAKLQDVMSKSSFLSSVPSATAATVDARAILEQLGIASSEAVSLVKLAVDEAGSGASASVLVKAAMKLRD
ncbi:MAG: Holliday junction branch migration protein RuvA [Candidatus Fermentibacteria bacterium]|nr:Holliday junction branch migration protein RuvA [Candidatus Fermentibacteria bacterium]